MYFLEAFCKFGVLSVTAVHQIRDLNCSSMLLRLTDDFRLLGGSFSAKVPRSSAEVRRVFVHHILEDEVDGQKEEQGDQREDDEEEEVNGDVGERATIKHTR